MSDSEKEIHHYDDIIDLPHPTSKNHPRMTSMNRAAQFAPFAALTGYDAAVRETARLTDEKTTLDEGEVERIDRKLKLLADSLPDDPTVTVRYFRSDSRKRGGSYLTWRGKVLRVDGYERLLVTADGVQIPFEDISDISGRIFEGITRESENAEN